MKQRTPPPRRYPHKPIQSCAGGMALSIGCRIRSDGLWGYRRGGVGSLFHVPLAFRARIAFWV